MSPKISSDDAVQTGKTILVQNFRTRVSAAEVKETLDKITSENDVIEAIRVSKHKAAMVQFTNTKSAEEVSYAAVNGNLIYGTDTLTVTAGHADFIWISTQKDYHIPSLHVYFGCQVSATMCHVFGEVLDASVKRALPASVDSDTPPRKVIFFVSANNSNYKLELSNEDYWTASLQKDYKLEHSDGDYSAPELQKKFLIVRLCNAPRIYKKKDSEFEFYRLIENEQWVRETDFTRSFSIGKSSHMVLEFNAPDLINIKELFPGLRESPELMTLKNDSYFSIGFELVPRVSPPVHIRLPFDILFKVDALVQRGLIPGPVLDNEFFELINPYSQDNGRVERVLEKLSYLDECCYDPVLFISQEYKRDTFSSSPLINNLDPGLVYIKRVQITPSKMYFCGPEVNLSNRVLRQYAKHIDRFLRVSFIDEGFERLYPSNLCTRDESSETSTPLYERVLDILRNGIVIGNKKFEFLAYSSSQLRSNSVWMFASDKNLNAHDIRNWMGNFDEIKVVAKYGSRLGLSFGASFESLSVGEDELELIDDIYRDEYLFSDGIGKISNDFATKVSEKCGYSFTPSAFQIRIGGYKGVVAIDPRSNKSLSLRKSMLKFKSPHRMLDILGVSDYRPCFLNRQIITLLSTLGIQDQHFLAKQEHALKLLNDWLDKDYIFNKSGKNIGPLEMMSTGENREIITAMLSCGYQPMKEPFLLMMLQAFSAACLHEMRVKTKIFVPQGRLLMGCVDETSTLDYGYVFVQYSHYGKERNEQKVHEGRVVVAKNPCLHPGDVRILTAVRVPELSHMVDCIVFPQLGPRPHPDECSGSDLDGDIYFVCWDKDLIPAAADAPVTESSTKPTPSKSSAVSIEDVEQYFAEFISHDNLGTIANTHTVHADKETKKARDEKCIDLAKLFMTAVDSTKTGKTAQIPQSHRVSRYPHFMQKDDFRSYHSSGIIGKLFDIVKDHTEASKSFGDGEAYDRDMEAQGFKDHIDEAVLQKAQYDYKLDNLMKYYGIEKEQDLVCGGIMRTDSRRAKRNDIDGAHLAVRALRKEARRWLMTSNTGEAISDETTLYAKASARYYVTYDIRYWRQQQHYISFPWCCYDYLVKIKQGKLKERQT